MTQYYRRNPNILYHSDTYLGQDYSDGIRHWKYIKREKRNGKWVYYYKDDNLAKAKKRYDTDKAAIKYENDKRRYGNNNKIHFRYNGKDIDDPTYRKLGQDVFESEVNYKFAKNKSDKRKKKYKTPIKVLNKASDASYNIKKKIKKGKKTVSKLLKKAFPEVITYTTNNETRSKYRNGKLVYKDKPVKKKKKKKK